MAQLIYQRGAKSPAVSQIQAKLKELGYYDGNPGNRFNSETEDAVKKFQVEKGLTADGVVGPQTWNVLFSSYKFSNTAKHVGSQGNYKWFEWEVFMDEPAEKLQKVKSVEYRLHETFPDPIRIIDDRESRFTLKSSGWGEFWIFITIYLTDRTEERTQYYLKLG